MKLAFITPVHGPHAALLDMACAQMDRLAPHVQHIVIVSKKEHALFRHLATPRRQILYKEDILPGLWGRTYLRFRQREIFFHRLRLAGGWIVQQLIKLVTPEFCDADIFVFLDADVFLVRPLLDSAFVSNGQVRLLRHPVSAPTLDQMAWHRTACELLGISVEAVTQHDYVGPLVSWRRDLCLGLRSHLENRWQQPLASRLTRKRRLSEYTLYGLYADKCAPQPNGHFSDGDELCFSSWSFDPQADMADAMTRALRTHHVAVNLQSNLRWPAERYAATLRAITNGAVLR